MRLPPMPRVPARTIRLWMAIAAAVVLVFASYYQVEPDEVGVVQRFGSYVRTTEPGPHLKFPFAESRHQGPRAAPAQDGVRLPHRASRAAH